MIYELGRGSETLSGGYLDLIMIFKVCKVASAAGSAKVASAAAASASTLDSCATEGAVVRLLSPIFSLLV
jgi:hypothetical protein